MMYDESAYGKTAYGELANGKTTSCDNLRWLLEKHRYMVTNVAKTELKFFQRPKYAKICPDSIIVNNEEIKPKDLSKFWDSVWKRHVLETHYGNLLNKARYTLTKMIIIPGPIMNEKGHNITVVRFHSLWIPSLAKQITYSKYWQILNVVHYKQIRAVCRDCKRKISGAELDSILNRAKPN